MKEKKEIENEKVENQENKNETLIKSNNNSLVYVLIGVIIVCLIGYITYSKFINNPESNVNNNSNNEVNKNDDHNNNGYYEESNHDTGSFYKFGYCSIDYCVSINSSKTGHPSSGFTFVASAEINEKEYDNEKYKVSYDVGYSEIYKYNAKKDYNDIDTYPTVTINDKVFKYKKDNTSILLIYQPEDIECYITITVSIGYVFEKNGDYAYYPGGNFPEGKYVISIDDVTNNNIAGIINFEFEDNNFD